MGSKLPQTWPNKDCILLHIVGFLQPRITMHGTTNNKKKKNEFFLMFSSTFVWHFSRSKKKWARYGQTRISVLMQSTTRSSCQILTELEFSRQTFEKFSNIKFHENPSRGSQQRVRWTHGQTGMTTLIVAFRNFANSPKNLAVWYEQPHLTTKYQICIDIVRTQLNYIFRFYTT